MEHRTLEEARAAKKRATSVFKPFAPVAGVGLTREKEGYGLKVNLQTSPQGKEPLPTDVDGVPVRIEVVGRIEKRTPSKVRTRIARSSQ